MGAASFGEGHWTSADGLELHYRDYAGPADRPALLCLPGLTRNARDFEPLAESLAGQWRMICPDLRGRGASDYAKDSANYTPETYLADIEILLGELGLTQFVAIGTSLGGILTMLLALGGGDRILGAVLNDVGPEIEEIGLERIRDYVGQGRTFPTWLHAARALEETMRDSYPKFAISDWLDLAKRLMAISTGGRIAFDYDMKIAEPFNEPRGGAPVDMWPAWQALAGKPVLVLRGELSDILSAATMARMAESMPEAEYVTVADVGHAPVLDEPEAQAAIARLLARVG